MTLSHLPPGVDFAAELVAGMGRHLAHLPPQDWGSATLYLNTRRMQRRVQQIFAEGPARILPRMRLITDLGLDPLSAPLPLPVPPLQRRLELCCLIAPLLDSPDAPAPRSALFDLAQSLAALMDEMAGEGVDPGVLSTLDISGHAAHWDRSLAFLSIVQDWQAQSGAVPDREARQRAAIQDLIARWANQPPDGPVIVAGSTGSRGATALFLAAVARLPQGAVVLPGFDSRLPRAVWDAMSQAAPCEDHPQFRFRRLADAVGVHPADIPAWTDALPPDPARNGLISLSLRPAPVTDQWLIDGPGLGPLGPATRGMTLVEASSTRAEAEVIALRLRAAVDEGRRAALITPDRGLTRQVAAALDRWNILPDDSAGVPLGLTPPGRLLRQAAQVMAGAEGPTGWLSLLKHPLVNSSDRGPHLLQVQGFELWLRRNGPAMANVASLQRANAEPDWAAWLVPLMCARATDHALSAHVAAHLRLAETLVAGPHGQPGPLWDKPAGRAAQALMLDLARHAASGPALSGGEYLALFDTVISGAEVREPDAAHPGILFWGTIEARVGGADLVILGGMNDGIWPEAPPPDPWLNRAMRLQAGLLLPERRIGLSAHDYQQAMAAPEVWITRATRDASAQTVPSRWLNRLTNLLYGLPKTGGRDALQAMRDRGQAWLKAAARLSQADPVLAAPRPSPRPPVAHRPRRLSVSDIHALVRDPYAVYARKVLRLESLDPLVPSADALLRGNILHQFLERAVTPETVLTVAGLMQIADQVLERDCPWPLVQRQWRAGVGRWADWFVMTETARRAIGSPAFREEKGEIALSETDITLVAKADRIDVTPDGRLVIYDYKSSKVPSTKAQLAFDKQLLIEAAMAERGAFAAVGPSPVQAAVYLGLSGMAESAAPLVAAPPDRVWEELTILTRAWQSRMLGYTARRAVQSRDDQGNYDHLSRFGEWDDTSTAVPIDVGPP